MEFFHIGKQLHRFHDGAHANGRVQGAVAGCPAKFQVKPAESFLADAGVAGR